MNRLILKLKDYKKNMSNTSFYLTDRKLKFSRQTSLPNKSTGHIPLSALFLSKLCQLPHLSAQHLL